MAENGSYRTKQREAVYHILEQSGPGHITIDDVQDSLKAAGEKVGRTTIYRYMEKLALEGVLRKYYIEEGAGACYQFVKEDEGCQEHFHLKCLQCGKLIHVECDYLDSIAGHIFEHHHFRIDNTKTVLYGTCEACAGNCGKK